MSIEDDEWSYEYLMSLDKNTYDVLMGVMSFRFVDNGGVVQRAYGKGKYWDTVCKIYDLKVVLPTVKMPDPGPVTCIQCSGSGA